MVEATVARSLRCPLGSGWKGSPPKTPLNAWARNISCHEDMSGTESGAVELIPLNIPKSFMSLIEGAALFVLVLVLALLEGP